MNSHDADAHLSITAAVPDRRHFPPYSVNVQIELHPEDTDVPLRLETTDLSRGGCYIQLMMPLPVGLRLNATLWLNDVPILIRGCVVTRHPQFGNESCSWNSKKGTKNFCSNTWTK